jgi:hypothetical protein
MTSANAAMPEGRFDFQHPDLRRSGTEFVRDDAREVVLKMNFGDLTGTLSLDSLASSLQIPAAHPDQELLSLTPAALQYVRRIRTGDAIPSELVDGRPSWLPHAHVLQRAAGVVWRALQGPLAALQPGTVLPPPGNASANLQQAAQLLLQLLPGVTVEEVEERMHDVIVDVARVDWLLRSMGTLQRTVGELAQFAVKHGTDPIGDLARRCALLLRNVAVWGTEKAMMGDAAVGDVNRLLADPGLLKRRAWPTICMLRALVLDVEPIVLRWSEANGREGGPRLRDLEDMLRLTSQRYGQFDPDIFLPRRRLADGSRGGFDA